MVVPLTLGLICYLPFSVQIGLILLSAISPVLIPENKSLFNMELQRLILYLLLIRLFLAHLVRALNKLTYTIRHRLGSRYFVPAPSGKT